MFVPSNTRQQIPNFAGGGEFLALDQRPKKIPKDEPGGIGPFPDCRKGVLASDAFGPADDAVHVRLHQQNAAHVRAVHTGFERGPPTSSALPAA